MSRGRAYYTDAYTTRFASDVVETTEGGQPTVQLATTYFYPTSGGQPHDTGRLCQGDRVAQVVDVVVREADGAVLHVLDIPLNIGEVVGEVDWTRRFDHMQHHTGQHILSQAFIRTAGAETISFHLSPQSVTIDLDRADIDDTQLRAAEELANDIVVQNRPVLVRDVTREQAAALPLRKVPPGRDGRLRLIDIDAFDLTACGGTHVAHTGEVGMIKVLKVERRGPSSRVEFCCGSRALADYRLKHEIVQGLSAALTTGQADLLPAVGRLQDETRQLRGELKREQSMRLRMEAAQLLGQFEPLGDARLVSQVFDGRDADEVRQLANILAEAGRTVALMGCAGESAQLVFCRSSDAPGIMGGLIRIALSHLDAARGGGGPAFAQGGGPPADVAEIAAALRAARDALRTELNAVE